MDKFVSFVLILNPSLIFSPNNVHIVPKIRNPILILDNVPGSRIILISLLSITGHKMVRQCLLHSNNLYLALLKNLTTTVKNAKFVSCLNIGVSREILVFNVLLERFLIQMTTNVKNLKQMI